MYYHFTFILEYKGEVVMVKNCILIYVLIILGIIILGISLFLIEGFFGCKLFIIGLGIYLVGMLLIVQNKLECKINKLATKEDIEDLKKDRKEIKAEIIKNQDILNKLKDNKQALTHSVMYPYRKREE